MRTHLLQTTYRPSAAEADTGHAANDADYLPALAQPGAAMPAARPAEIRARIEDDYVLGGYAGI
jgi:hypothetical protein